MQEKYEKLFELRKKSLELFKKTAGEIRPEQLDYSELQSLGKLEDRFIGPKNTPWFARKRPENFVNNHNRREVARYLLLIHFADRLGYYGLLEIFESPDADIQEKTWQQLDKLGKNQQDYQALINILEKLNEHNNKGVRRLLLKYFPEQLEQSLLIDLMDSKEPDIRKEAEKLLRMLGQDGLDLQLLLDSLERSSSFFRDNMKLLLLDVFADRLEYPVILRFMHSLESDVRDKAQHSLDEFNPERLNFEVLLETSKSEDFGPRDGAIKLLLDRFVERLSYQILVELLNRCGLGLRDRIRKLLLENFADQLDDEILLNCTESEDIDVVRKAWCLLESIKTEKISLKPLMERLHSQGIKASNGLRYLLLKHCPERLSCWSLLSCLTSYDSEIKDMAWQILNGIDVAKLDRQVISCHSCSENWDIRNGAQKLLDKIKASEESSLNESCEKIVSLFNDAYSQ